MHILFCLIFLKLLKLFVAIYIYDWIIVSIRKWAFNISFVYLYNVGFILTIRICASTLSVWVLDVLYVTGPQSTKGLLIIS